MSGKNCNFNGTDISAGGQDIVMISSDKSWWRRHRLSKVTWIHHIILYGYRSHICQVTDFEWKQRIWTWIEIVGVGPGVGGDDGVPHRGRRLLRGRRGDAIVYSGWPFPIATPFMEETTVWARGDSGSGGTQAHGNGKSCVSIGIGRTMLTDTEAQLQPNRHVDFCPVSGLHACY